MGRKEIVSSVLAASILLSSIVSNNEVAYSAALAEDEENLLNTTLPQSDNSFGLKITGETDDSISVSWNSAKDVSSYSIIVNGNELGKNINSNSYTITGLTSASEYFISIKAYDASEKELFTSDEICAYTNLTVDGDLTLSEDVRAANIIIKNGGNVNLNGNTLTVDGDVWITSGKFEVNKGKLCIGGDLNLSDTDKTSYGGYVIMQNDEDYILVGGDMYVYSAYNSSKFTAGTLEIKGDFTQKTYSAADNFYCTGTHKTILSGETLQTISFASTKSQFNDVEIQNFSEDGVVFATAATIVELLDNGCNVTFANGERSGWVLEEDEVISGDLNLARGTLDLNGHKLTVTGNLIQSGGSITVNGGELEVQGDYRIQALNGGNYVASPGTLTMDNNSDAVKVGGDFVMQSTKSHSGLLSAGTLEIAGDLKQLSGGSTYSFCTSGTHTVVLNGTEKQSVNIADNYKSYSSIANLKIENTSADGVDIEKSVYIQGKLYDTDSNVSNSSNLYIAATTEFPDNEWSRDLYIAENKTMPEDLSVHGSLYTESNVVLGGNTLTVDGDVWITSGKFEVNKGKLCIGGDLNLSDTDKTSYGGYVIMQNDEDYILVGGDMYVYSAYNSSKFTAGTLEIKGDFTQKTYSAADNFYCTGTHKTILSGETLQTISFASTKSQFNVMEITKPLNNGYVFNNNVHWNELVENYVDDFKPAAPMNLQFVRSTSTSVMIRWTKSIDSNRINCYEIYRDGKLVGTTSNTEYIDNGLNTHTQYEYYIVALGVNGVRSESSNTINAATDIDAYAPTTPTGLGAVIREDGSIYLTWMASNDNVRVDGYNLYRNGNLIGNTTGTAYNDKNAAPGYHEYYVEAFDNEGNNSLFSSSIYVDNMPPEQPVLHISEITPIHIAFKWDSKDNVEIDHFEIYKNGVFLKSTKSNEYVDTSVIAGEEYSYYVIAVDTSGNESQASGIKTISAKNDEEKPEIGIAEQTLTETNKKLRIVCADDVMLFKISAEIKPSSSETWQTVQSQALSQKNQIVNLDLSDYLTVGGEYDIQVSVTDNAGNTKTVNSKFSYVLNPLTDFTLAGKSDGCSIYLSWTAASKNDDVYYEIRRSTASGAEKCIAITKEGMQNFVDNGLYPLSEYSYSVIAHDNNMYTVKSNTLTVISGKDNVSPVASAVGNTKTIAGCETSFSGKNSKDNFGIKYYKWNFGDGNSAEGENVAHTFKTEGTYTVTLTVMDESGNTASDEISVTVYDENYSITEVQVVNENGRPIPYPIALAQANGATSNLFEGDANGIILIVAENGNYDFSFFANEYLPHMQNITINGGADSNKRQIVSLTKSELLTAEFNVSELTIDEVKDLGIDVTAPENQHVSKVEMHLENNESGDGSDESLGKFNVYVNENGEIIQVEHNGEFTAPVFAGVKNQHTSTNSKGTTTTNSTLTTLGGSSTNKSNKNKEQYRRLINGTMVSLSVTEYSWMKDFYEVSVSFTNNSEKGFDIINPTVTLNLPTGLSLANTNSLNSVTRSMNTINGGSTQTVSWIVKGDTKGSYTIGVDFEGILSPFGIPVTAKFENAEPIRVIGGDALKLTIDASKGSAGYTLKNISSQEIYNVEVGIDSYGEFKDAERIIAKYPSGLIEMVEWTSKDKTDVKRTVYLPVNMDADEDIFALRTLKPGEYITGMIWYSMKEVD